LININQTLKTISTATTGATGTKPAQSNPKGSIN